MIKRDSIEGDKFFKAVVGRSELEMLSKENLQSYYNDSRILIIGAGGSVGSAIARRLASAQIPELFFLDHDESALHSLALELSDISASQSERYLLADIRDYHGIKNAISVIDPTMVIHAAALKHLVTLERFPREGYLTNIEGTLNVATACKDLNVKQLINISTDKAANPISVLGKTKKLAELIVEEVFINSGLLQCSVRFGNVFASRGSVIETFVHQINSGIPVTITNMEVARFFMSHNEAANLVLAAASLKESGTFIQNMGEEVRMVDVANRIAKFLDRSATVKIIGLQEGEKLREELLDGPVIPTKFESILRSTYSVEYGIVEEVKENSPSNNEEAIKMLDSLFLRFTVQK